MLIQFLVRYAEHQESQKKQTKKTPPVLCVSILYAPLKIHLGTLKLSLSISALIHLGTWTKSHVPEDAHLFCNLRNGDSIQADQT